MTKTNGSSDSPAPGDTLDTTALQGVTMSPVGGILSVPYTAPYGIGPTVSSDIQFSLGTIHKTLTIYKFTAVCKD
jgi:hypothetical protein